ncbi:MAG: pyridoxamine 5'-phosphate oxidase family protein [Thermoplasmata archaeon]
MATWTAKHVSILDQARVLRVATISPQGDPFMALVRFYFDGASLYFAPATTSQQAAHLHANRRIAALVDTLEDGNLQGFVVQGLAQWVQGKRERDAVWEAMIAKYPDRPDEEVGGTLVRIDPVRVQDLGES